MPPAGVPVVVGVYFKSASAARSGGRCPVCDLIQDDSGCRVVRVFRIRRGWSPDGSLACHRALRSWLLTHPVGMEVACLGPEQLVERRRWRLANGMTPEPEPTS